MQRRLKAALPDAPLETVAESGFLVQADQPAELSSRLATFVRSLPPSADKLHNKKLNIQAQHEAEEVLARLAAGDPSLHAHSHSHDHFDAGSAPLARLFWLPFFLTFCPINQSPRKGWAWLDMRMGTDTTITTTTVSPSLPCPPLPIPDHARTHTD